MIGGLLKSTSRLAIIAAAGMFVGGLALTPAQAADLGGDCCADLEERVADLEATTARKGNRKVSLKISGHVARDFGWYEDEFGNSEFYSAGNGTSGSRVKFNGSAKLTSTWTAGYALRIRMDSRDSSVLGLAGTSQGNGAREALGVDENYVFLSNSSLGTFVAGQAYAPSSGISTISLGGFGVAADAGGNDWNRSSINGFSLDQDSSLQALAYISPTIAGFTLAAAWADLNVPSSLAGSASSATDAIDVALRYANEFGPIRIAAGIAYTTVDNNDLLGKSAAVMGSVALMHTPTGLNVNFAAGTEINGGLGGVGNTGTPAYNNDTTNAQYWYVAGGINQNFFGPGNTSLYGEYGHYNYDNTYNAITNPTGIVDDTVEMWGLGVVQHFDSAATELYLAYRNWNQKVDLNRDGIIDPGTDGNVSQVKAGMRIKF